MADPKSIDYVYGTFQAEIKNRFLCSVNIGGKDAVCYIPSSCRLSNFIDMTGRTVLLRPIETPNTRTAYLLDEGYRACYILVSLNPSVKEITINSEIEDYYKEFMKCIEKGMTYCAFSIRLHEQTPELYAKIKITI